MEEFWSLVHTAQTRDLEREQERLQREADQRRALRLAVNSQAYNIDELLRKISGAEAPLPDAPMQVRSEVAHEPARSGVAPNFPAPPTGPTKTGT